MEATTARNDEGREIKIVDATMGLQQTAERGEMMTTADSWELATYVKRQDIERISALGESVSRAAGLGT